MSSVKRLLARGVLPALLIGATWSSATLGRADAASTNTVPAKLCTLKLQTELRAFPIAVRARDTCTSRPPATPGAQGGTLYEADVGKIILTVESHFIESLAVAQKRRLDAASIEHRVALGSWAFFSNDSQDAMLQVRAGGILVNVHVTRGGIGDRTV